jgi:hypothetical protein
MSLNLLDAFFDSGQNQIVKYSFSFLRPTSFNTETWNPVLERSMKSGHVGIFEVVHNFNPKLLESFAEGLSLLVDSGSFDRLTGSSYTAWWDPLTWLHANGYAPNKEIFFSKFYQRYLYNKAATHHFLEWLLTNGVELTPGILNEIDEDGATSERAQFVLKLIKQIKPKQSLRQ